MDFITHTLMGTGLGRLAAPRRELLPQFCLAGALGSLLQDGDSWLHLLGPNHYGLYHRVVTHSLLGLTVVGCVAGLMAWGAGGVGAWRRFGWYVSPNLPADASVVRAPLGGLIGVGLVAAYLHWCADVITGFGNLTLFWPWSNRDFSLHAVYSFDAVIFSATLAWHILIRRLDWPRRRESALTAGYMILVIAYVFVRWKWGTPTVW